MIYNVWDEDNQEIIEGSSEQEFNRFWSLRGLNMDAKKHFDEIERERKERIRLGKLNEDKA